MSQGIELVTFRPVTVEDEPFLEEMGYLAAFAINGSLPEGTPTLQETRQTDWFPDNNQGWGRESDFGLIATDGVNSVGAAWYRKLGWNGYPPITVFIGIDQANQERGLGTKLLVSLLGHAQEQNVPEVVLQVRKENTIAKHVYEKLGFVVVGQNSKDDCDVMTVSTSAFREK